MAMLFLRSNRSAQHSAIIGLAVSALAGGLWITNPPQSAYEQYAVDRMSTYLSRHVCADLPVGLGDLLKQQCNQILQANQSKLLEIVQANTQAQNYYLFSLYRTQMGVPTLDMLPVYQIETLGIFNQFFTYKISQQGSSP